MFHRSFLRLTSVYHVCMFQLALMEESLGIPSQTIGNFLLRLLAVYVIHDRRVPWMTESKSNRIRLYSGIRAQSGLEIRNV